MRARVEDVLLTSESGVYEEAFRVIWNDGSVHWVRARGRAYANSDEQPTKLLRFSGTMVDITERKRAEEQLRESEQRFRSTFEQAAVGISHMSLDGTWLRVNQRLCNIVGYRREELLQRTWRDITHPDDLEEDLANLQEVLAGVKDSYTMEKRYVSKEGSIVWVHITISLLRADGKPLYLIAVVEDISDRRRAEEALRESEAQLRTLNETLEARVRARTKQVRALASDLTVAEQR